MGRIGRATVIVPVAAQDFVHGHQCGGCLRFGLGKLVLRVQQEPFGIEHGQEIRRAVVVTVVGEGRPPPGSP